MQTASGPSRALIFGGTFDPPHRAHIELPQAAARELGCDRIIYIPAAINPLKVSPDQPAPTAAQHRLEMLRLALADIPNAEISTTEFDRTGPSYTIETLQSLHVVASSAFLLIGADQALDFHRWKDWREILILATPAVMLRPPWTASAFHAALRERYDADEVRHWQARTLGTLPMIDVSATEIRQRIAGGGTLNGLVDPRVEAYIRRNRLYGAG